MSTEPREAQEWDQRHEAVLGNKWARPKLTPNWGSRLEVHNCTGIGIGTDLLLNGAKVPGVRRLRIDWDADSAVVATLEIRLESIDLDTATLLELVAVAQPADPAVIERLIAAPLLGVLRARGLG